MHFTAAIPVGGCSDYVLGGLLLTARLRFQGIRVGWWLGNADLYLAGERRVLFDIQIRLTFRYHIVSNSSEMSSMCREDTCAELKILAAAGGLGLVSM